jgi:hypothetical protein
MIWMLNMWLIVLYYTNPPMYQERVRAGDTCWVLTVAPEGLPEKGDAGEIPKCPYGEGE